MHTKWFWILSFIAVIAIIMIAVNGVNKYNEQLEAGSSNPDVVKSEGQLVEKADPSEEVVSSKESAEDSIEVSTETKEPERVLAPDFTLQDLEGKDVSIKDFRGKKVFLIFWATWCPYCKKQMPLLQELENENREDLVILTVATADSLSLEKHMKDNGFTMRVVRDYSKTLDKIQFKYKAMTIPGNFLIDEEGYIVAQRNSFSTREVMDKFLSEFDES